MKMKANILVVLLMLSMISAIPMIATRSVSAEPVPDGSKIVWEDGTGAAAATLKWNPEFLQLLTKQYTNYETIITIDGKDTFGQVIEASVCIPADTPMSSSFTFVDSTSGCPVAFAEIDNIFQQYGTNGDQFEILTCPVPYETTGKYLGQYYGQYLGEYYQPTSTTFGYYPGYNDYINNAPGTFLFANGQGNPYSLVDYPVQPCNPDPLIVYINWKNLAEDLYPKSTEFPTGGASASTTLTIEGMDEAGNKAIGICTITKGDTSDPVVTYHVNVDGSIGAPENHTFSTVCSVSGGISGDEYFILTDPVTPAVHLFYYTLRIDHVTVHPLAFDILANPYCPMGDTQVFVMLRDVDNNPIRASDCITVNFATTGGYISPSCDVYIPPGCIYAFTNLTADTNPRTVKVSVDAMVPASGNGRIPAENLQAFSEVTFDGVNSAFSTAAAAWPITTLECGYITYDCEWEYFLAPGPDPVCCPYFPFELNGPIYEVSIPLYKGCNLISSPVYTMWWYWQYLISAPYGPGIPMQWLFSATDAFAICAIWSYNASSRTWNCFSPLLDGLEPICPATCFQDGVGYWIKANQACTLEISGVMGENGPFTPAEYPVYSSWNLMGFTSVNGLATSAYLESLATGSTSTALSAVGPVYVYDAQNHVWTRDPAMLWPGQGFWMNFKDTTDAKPPLSPVAYLSP